MNPLKRPVCAILFLGTSAQAGDFFAGALGGVGTLSADGTASVTETASRVSSYKPENGAALNVFAGRHWGDWFSLQAAYQANRNELSMTAVAVSAAESSAYEQFRRSSQHGFLVEAMMYFRARPSRLRPWLSAGPGVFRMRSQAIATRVQRPGLELPPAEFSSTGAALRVAVGIDISIAKSWSFRYSFAETIRSNPVSARMTPRGERNLATFQNLFGVMKSF